MTSTLTDYLTEVRSRLDESSAHQWSDAELTRWINEGLRDVARRTETIQSTSNVTASIGTQQYALPSDTLRIYRVEWRPTSGSKVIPLEYRDFHNMDAVWWSQQTSIQSTPYFFTTWGFPPSLNMVVYPTPSEAGVFKVYYYRLPATLASGSDVAEIPAGWQDLVISYCEYIALRKDHDPRWTEAKQLYEVALDQMHDMTRRWSDQYGLITNDTTAVPAWIWNEDWY